MLCRYQVITLFIIPLISYMRKLRLRKVKWFVQGHTAVYSRAMLFISPDHVLSTERNNWSLYWTQSLFLTNYGYHPASYASCTRSPLTPSPAIFGLGSWCFYSSSLLDPQISGTNVINRNISRCALMERITGRHDRYSLSRPIPLIKLLWGSGPCRREDQGTQEVTRDVFCAAWPQSHKMHGLITISLFRRGWTFTSDSQKIRGSPLSTEKKPILSFLAL